MYNHWHDTVPQNLIFRIRGFNIFDAFSFSYTASQWAVPPRKAVRTLNIVLFLTWHLRETCYVFCVFSKGTGNLVGF